MFLVDTSVWIEALRKGARLRIESICSPDEIVLVLPVFQEVLQGVREESSFRLVRDALTNARFVESPLRIEVFEEAVDLYRLARGKGLTIRSSVDCVIAACAIRHDLTVVHRDRDFPQIKKVSRLKEKRV